MMKESKIILIQLCVISLFIGLTSSAPSYFVVSGRYLSCEDLGGTSITTSEDCLSAADVLGFRHGASPSSTSSGSYPTGCHINTAATADSSFLVFNSNTGAIPEGTNTRKPLCVDPDGEITCMGPQILGTDVPDPDNEDHFMCSDDFTPPTYSRQGQLFWGYIPDEDRGVISWDLDTRAGVSEAKDLDGNNIWEPYELVWTNAENALETNGVAFDQENDYLYFFYASQYQSCGVCYHGGLIRYHVGTKVATELVGDQYPYLCNDLSTPTFRSPITFDSVNNRLWWLSSSVNPAQLYSMDLAGPAYIPTLRAELDISDNQFSQITADCNGNVWFTDIFDGLWFYVVGWDSAVLMINEPDLNGVTIIREPGTKNQRFVVGKLWSANEYTFPGATSEVYPFPPKRNAIGSENDRPHNFQWDPQNEIMCLQTKTSDGDYIITCYDPADDPNLVWNYIRGAFPRQQLVIRYGDYTFFDPYYVPQVTSEMVAGVTETDTSSSDIDDHSSDSSSDASSSDINNLSEDIEKTDENNISVLMFNLAVSLPLLFL